MSLPVILVADDEPGLRDLAAYLLEPLGYEVVTACDGREAVELVRQRQFDLVILDVHMPVMGGREALAKIKELRPTQKVMIVSGSADITHDFEARAVQEGALACLFKPLSIDELTSIVVTTLGKPNILASA